jgi:hypothetical protein
MSNCHLVAGRSLIDLAASRLALEHVHVNEGGQALIGNVRKDVSGAESEE